MKHTPKLGNWPDVLDHLCFDFPELDKDVLLSTAGALDVVALHLAKAHDLTPNEAIETLRDWKISYMPAAYIRPAA